MIKITSSAIVIILWMVSLNMARADQWFDRWSDQMQRQLDRQNEQYERQNERQNEQYERQRDRNSHGDGTDDDD
ncbi:MAG TPA: hypothetical protein VGP28_04360 [Methylocella sp.]|jgi:hypothetical protein|nr:hypothetical protein [Methylocella sp.]